MESLVNLSQFVLKVGHRQRNGHHPQRSSGRRLHQQTLEIHLEMLQVVLEIAAAS
jgi:hypothetical protein